MPVSETPQQSLSFSRRVLQTLRAPWLRSSWRLAFDMALPPLCPSCREPVADHGLCPACWAKLSPIERPFCEKLGIPFVYDPGPDVLSMQARADPPVYGRARAAFCYDEVAKNLVHVLKYGDRLDLAPIMGRWMARAGADLLVEADVIVPVPLHWRRLWARRFNQSAALAMAIADIAGLPLNHKALRRKRATRQQVGLSRQARARNMQDAFEVRESDRAAIKGQRLLLVDDVLTSGATLEACTRALLRAGAKEVNVLVFARVVEAGSAAI